MCAQFFSLSCSVFVTLDCTPHRVAQVSLVRVISWSSHDERISSTLSPPFSCISSSSHSSLTSCTSSCTSSTTLRAAATLCTPPQRVWTLLTTPTFSHCLLVEFFCFVGTLTIGGGDRARHLWISRARYPGPSWLAIEVFNVGRWPIHGDLALEAQVDNLAEIQHRLIPAQARCEWARHWGKGLASIWALAGHQVHAAGGLCFGHNSRSTLSQSLQVLQSGTIQHILQWPCPSFLPLQRVSLDQHTWLGKVMLRSNSVTLRLQGLLLLRTMTTCVRFLSTSTSVAPVPSLSRTVWVQCLNTLCLTSLSALVASGACQRRTRASGLSPLVATVAQCHQQ